MQSIKENHILLLFRSLLNKYPSSFAAAFRSRIVSITSFFTTLYYLEIVLFMFNLVLVMGKAIAVITGLILAGLLSVHIIYLNSGSNTSRIIQLILMDIHAAVTLSFIPELWYYSVDLNAVSLFVLIIRIIMVAIEIPLIYLLTDESVKRIYSK